MTNAVDLGLFQPTGTKPEGQIMRARMPNPASAIPGAWLSDRADAVPDALCDEVARNDDERGLAVPLLWIATANTFNRLNVPARPAAGALG